MDKRKERQIAYYYLNNAVRSSIFRAKESYILDWVEHNSLELFGFDLEYVWDKCGRERYCGGRRYKKYESGSDGVKKKMLHRGIKTVRAMVDHCGVVDINERGYDRNTDMVFDVFKLSPPARVALRYFIYCERTPLVESLNSSMFNSCSRKEMKECRPFSAITGMSQQAVEKVFGFDGELVRSGIIEKMSDGDVSLTDSFKRMICSNPTTEAQVRKRILGGCASASLVRGNFDHIAGAYDHIKTVLDCAVKKRVRGMNILIYGPPGTGKTEMCKSITRDIGARLYTLSESADGDKDDRIHSLSIAQALLRNERDSVILFDEAEDAFTRNMYVGDRGTRYTKLYFNRMLEENQTPVIWISNDIRWMDRAYIRRFKYALEVKKPDQAAKEGIWKNICVKHKVKLGKNEIAEYARAYDVAPSFIDTAVETAKLTGSTEVIERTIVSLQKATHGVAPIKKRGEDVAFDPALLNTDVDLVNLVDKLAEKGKQKFSLCLYGEPGTGKSAFARYLAERLGLAVEQKRASDLMSCWVGESEKNIARAFEEARDTKALLVFDEADSFLRSRKMADHSWEATLVNEMLTQMESHPYPFVCTTNLMRDLDEASLRRFMFKVKYEFMKPPQVRLAFDRFFGIDIDDGINTRVSINHLTHLTPGDFAVVKGKSDFLDIDDAAELVRLLESEQGAKGVKSVKMGFA